MFSALLLEQRMFLVEFHHGLLSWLLIGLLAGWLAGKLSHGRGYGCITNVALGLIGAVLGGWIFWKLGIFGGGFIYSLASATVGAVLLVAIARLFSGTST